MLESMLFIRWILFLVFLIPCSVRAGGFEPNNLFSARYIGMGGAAASSVEGAQSISFNPAGLAATPEWDLDMNAAGGLTHRNVPIVPDAPNSTSTTFAPLLASFGSHQLSKGLGVGAGLFIAGGVGAEFGNQNYGSNYPALQPDVGGTIALIEFGVGAGYEILDGLRIGATWRPTYVGISSNSAALVNLNNTQTLLALQYNSLHTIAWDGFRFGIQYGHKDQPWGVGATLRTALDFNANGNLTGTAEQSGGASQIAVSGGNVTASSKFPLLMGIGFHYDINPEFRLVTQYEFLWGNQVQSFAVSGDPVTLQGVTTLPASALSIPLDWKNESRIRVGAEYRPNESRVWRIGYVYASAMTPANEANAVFTAPGPEHNLDLGMGWMNTTVLGHRADVDLAFDFSINPGTAENSIPGSLNGTYTLTSYALHVGVRY